MAEAVRPPAALRSHEIGWRALATRGASVKVLRHDKDTGGSTALVRFEAGTPDVKHAASSEGGCVFLVTLPKPVEFLES